jgi:hypothetical protein
MTEWKPTLEQKRRLENPAPNRKLTVEQVLEIRMLQAQGKADFKRLSQQYGVDRNAIRMAALGHTFKELPMPPDQARRNAREDRR